MKWMGEIYILFMNATHFNDVDIRFWTMSSHSMFCWYLQYLSAVVILGIRLDSVFDLFTHSVRDAILTCEKKEKKNEEKVHCNLNTCHFMKNLCTESFSLIFCSILVNEHNKAVVVIYVFHNSFYDIRFSSLLLLFCMDFFYFILFNSFHFGVLFFSCFFFVFVDLILLELTTAAIFPMDFNRIEILFHFVFFSFNIALACPSIF